MVEEWTARSSIGRPANVAGGCGVQQT
jgi:hypothetical protein